jgi:hypothetical protein
MLELFSCFRPLLQLAKGSQISTDNDFPREVLAALNVTCSPALDDSMKRRLPSPIL